VSALDRIIPTPGLVEVDEIDLAVPPAEAWAIVRHADFGELPLVRALFGLRKVPDRITGHDASPVMLRIDDLSSTAAKPGFQVLVDDAPNEVVVGAIGKVWHLTIPFVHVSNTSEYTSFAEPGWVKVAWAIRLSPIGEGATRLHFEVRVDATDASSWKRFRRYFRFIGGPSRFIRKSLLASLGQKLGTPESVANERPLAGDERLPDAEAQVTHGIDIHAPPAAIWPWLLQMGLGRAGFYSIDALDNLGRRSAREVHPDLQDVRVGDVLPADNERGDGFEVLAVDREHALVLGGLWDVEARQQRPFASARPDRFWQVTWSFVLQPIDAVTTHLHVRARAAFPKSGQLHATWIRSVHTLMETTQLERLKARAEGRLPRDDWRDVVEGIGGLGVMIAAFLSPFLRNARSHWGLDAATAELAYPGDHLVAHPRWSWTHAVEVEACAADVWPWIVQLGADRGGFYSYQWLENIAGCELRNAEAVHSDLALQEGSALVLHPEMPALDVVQVVPERSIVAYSPRDGDAAAAGRPWVEASWSFHLEPQGEARCRIISRYRVATSDDVKAELAFGPTLLEPIGFAMDRRMLLGIKHRAENARRRKPLRSFARRGELEATKESARRSP